MAWQAIKLHVLVLVGVTVAHAARAEVRCVRVPAISGQIQAFFRDVGSAQAAGTGLLPIREVLIGVTNIAPADAQALDARNPAKLEKSSDQAGVFFNEGPQDIFIQGTFASRTTYFKIPRLVKGKYTYFEDRVELFYDPEHTIQLGESHLGMKFFRSMNHTVITKTQLSFFFDSNAKGSPDRCYLATGD